MQVIEQQSRVHARLSLLDFLPLLSCKPSAMQCRAYADVRLISARASQNCERFTDASDRATACNRHLRICPSGAPPGLPSRNGLNVPARLVQLTRRYNGVDFRAFPRVGRGHCPETPHRFCVGASRNASQCNKSTNSQAGRKFFSRGLIDTAACEGDVFDTANTICFARSKSKGEKECITELNNRTFRRNWPTT